MRLLFHSQLVLLFDHSLSLFFLAQAAMKKLGQKTRDVSMFLHFG